MSQSQARIGKVGRERKENKAQKLIWYHKGTRRNNQSGTCRKEVSHLAIWCMPGELTLENPSYFQKQAEHFMDGQIKREQSTTTENLIRAKQEGENII